MSASTGNGLINPFPGLRPFREEEEYLFFGRESQVDVMVDRLAATRFLAVVGTSGSGKSSLVNCGLKPALHRGVMASAGSVWRMAQFRPGGDPFRALARSLALPGVSGLKVEGENLEELIEATLEMSDLGVVDLFEQAELAGRANLLLIVDQFEELFRYATPQTSLSHHEPDRMREASVAFVNLLLQAAKSEHPIYVVLTMRSDFLGDCARFQGLPEAINQGQYLVPRLTREERRIAISGPIAVGGGQISPVLLTRLVNDVGDNPDQLSILQHALNRTWAQWRRERHGNESLSLSHYEAIGTMAHALDRHAEEAFAELISERRKEICEVIFQALTDKGNDARGIRRPTSFVKLCAIADASPADVAEVMEVFRIPTRSFLMPPSPEPLEPETIIDISHESLMRIWDRLSNWVEREAEAAGQYRRLIQSAHLEAKGLAGLMTDPELALMLQWRRVFQPTAAWAERYDSSFTEAMDFLDRSQREQDRVVAEKERARKRTLRQTQWAAGILGLLAAIAVSLAFLAIREKNHAETNLQLAKKAVDESLSSAGRQQARAASDVPELEEFRKELLGKAAGFYAVFAKQDSQNQALRGEVALAHTRLGDINRLMERHEDAARDYKEAISRFEALVKDYPGNKEYRQGLAYAHNWLGETLRIWREESPGAAAYSLPDGEREYDAALALQIQLHDQEPTNSVYQQELARTYYNRGIIRHDERNDDGAVSDSRAAIALLEPLTRAPATASNPGTQEELARVYSNLASMLIRTNPKMAEMLYGRAVDLAEVLSNAQPGNRQFQFELAEYLDNQARLLVAENELDQAMEKNHRALDILLALVNPVPSLSIELLKTLQLRTEILGAKGSNEAKTESDRLFEALKRLNREKTVQGHPVFHVIILDLGINYLEIAKRSLKSGDLNEAGGALEKLAQVLPDLSAADRPTLTQAYQELREELQNKLGRRPRRK